MNKFHFFCLLPLLAFALYGCEGESNASPVIITFDDFATMQSVESGEKIRLTLSSRTVNQRIEKFAITSFDSELGEKALLDTTPSTNQFTYVFNYTVPEFTTDSIKQELIFSAVDNTNAIQKRIAYLIIKGGNIILTERSGLKLYAGNSGRENGFSLSNPAQTFITEMADSAQIDIYAYADSTNTSDKLSREWRTNTDVSFAKMNTFDYVNATKKSVSSAFNSAIRSSYVKEIKQGDLILIGKAGQAWGIIQVVIAYDEEGTLNDGYLLNYKQTESN